MRDIRRHAAWFLLFAISAALLAAEPARQLDESRRALHALNRLTFGPRPGDVERVKRMGVDKWIEQQLHPEKIDDGALDARLGGFRTLRMSPEELVRAFPPPQVLRAVAQGRVPLPRDPQQRAIYENAMERRRDQQEKKAEAQSGPEMAQQMDDAQRAGQREARRAAREKAQQVLALSPDQRMAAILKLSPDERRDLAQVLTGPNLQQLLADFTPEQIEVLRAMVNPQSVVVTELQQAKILRAAYSERQLEEVMTDFWFNHFNVFLNKGPDRYLTTAYERDVIRKHALGKFQDLLLATAKSPAMLFYLDNWQSVGPRSFAAEIGPQLAQRRALRRNRSADEPPPPPRPAGLNENYGRELMELHTLGVDGGYSQKDVTEVAKVFTGWTIRQPRRGGDFTFNPRMHEPGPKYVLGREIKENGEQEAVEVLRMLARHPSTARFISRKLALRFVSDDPPAALVARMADTFQKTDGDIREVLRTLFRSREFWASDAYRAKVKTPLEFVVSAIRATGAEVQNAMPFVQALNQLGMPLYQVQPPTGYSMKAEAWVNSAALLGRMNFALRLASGRMPGVKLDFAALGGSGALPTASGALPATDAGNRPMSGSSPGSQGPDDHAAILALLENSLLAGDISQQTHDAILKQMENPQQVVQQIVAARPQPDSGDMNPAGQPRRNRPAQQAAFTGPPPSRMNLLAGLLLGSPEFQRR